MVFCYILIPLSVRIRKFLPHKLRLSFFAQMAGFAVIFPWSNPVFSCHSVAFANLPTYEYSVTIQGGSKNAAACTDHDVDRVSETDRRVWCSQGSITFEASRGVSVTREYFGQLHKGTVWFSWPVSQCAIQCATQTEIKTLSQLPCWMLKILFLFGSALQTWC